MSELQSNTPKDEVLASHLSGTAAETLLAAAGLEERVVVWKQEEKGVVVPYSSVVVPAGQKEATPFAAFLHQGQLILSRLNGELFPIVAQMQERLREVVAQAI